MRWRRRLRPEHVTAVSYRDATPDDCDALSALMRETFVATFGHLYSAEDLHAFLAAKYAPAVQYAEIIDPDRETRVAVRDDALVGYTQFGPMTLPYDAGPARALEIYRMYVVEDVKGVGVAAALMDWAIARMRERAGVYAFLSVWTENYRAQKFYARFGFEQVGEHDFAVGAQLDRDLIYRAVL